LFCAQLPRPEATEIDGDVYVRAAMPGVTTRAPLVEWSPAPTGTCVTRLASLDEFHKLVPAFEAGGRQLDRTARSIFKGPDVGRYYLLEALRGTTEGTMLLAEGRKLLGWSEEEARSPGAYPFRR
jgi:hypothetical protein